MSDDISPKEWETMSAYLDGQLGRKEQERLERSLDQNPAWLEALEGLRQTRTLLRSQPKVRATRNFTLTPELAGVQRERSKPGFAVPVLRTVSILASILFVFIFAGDLLTSGSFESNVPMVSAPEEELILMEKAAPQLAMPEEAMEEIESVQTDSSMAFEMEQEESVPGSEIEVPARMLETEPQMSNELDELGEDTVLPEAVVSSDVVEPGPLQEFYINNSGLRFLEVFLIVAALTTGVAGLYINRRNRER